MKTQMITLLPQQLDQVSGGVVDGGCIGQSLPPYLKAVKPPFGIDNPSQKLPGYVTLAIDENGGNFPFI
ncbi:hypothetical protein [Glaciecola petra]|uniref:Uncharacterized protein n=1 Tax=Glaciecola petra TaxID=3075602 RepID=A0ABU2ZL44_9ALTE|nr:hypothetical protein [Aestuariibacter sp. P117]MDT0593343.1 hypothetical protein [Aestuariibacter sp. P117]